MRIIISQKKIILKLIGLMEWRENSVWKLNLGFKINGEWNWEVTGSKFEKAVKLSWGGLRISHFAKRHGFKKTWYTLKIKTRIAFLIMSLMTLASGTPKHCKYPSSFLISHSFSSKTNPEITTASSFLTEILETPASFCHFPNDADHYDPLYTQKLGLGKL